MSKAMKDEAILDTTLPVVAEFAGQQKAESQPQQTDSQPQQSDSQPQSQQQPTNSLLPKVIELHQTGVSASSLVGFKRSGLMTASLLAVLVITGVPILFVHMAWSALHLSSLFALTDHQTLTWFKILYIFSVGAVLPPFGILLVLHFLIGNLQKFGTTLVVSERGLIWQTENAFVRQLMKFFGQPVEILSWSAIEVACSFESLESLKKDYNFSYDENIYIKKHRRMQTLSGLARSGYLGFVVRNPDGTLRTACSVFIAGLTPEARRELLSAIQRWAPNCLITRKATEELIGTQIEQRDLKFTEIWLDLMDNSRGNLRQDDLSAGDLLRENSAAVELEIVRKLATGGQANLYLAKEGRTGARPYTDDVETGAVRDNTESRNHAESELVVLKEYIPFSGTADGAVHSLQEFEAESAVLSRLSHTGIVKMEDMFVENGRAYIVLEYVKGISLRDHIVANGAMNADDVLRIGASIAEILAYLHGLEPAIIHRDITPDNIILMDNGHIKLVDFSVAVQGENSSPGEALGKPNYMSTDQFRGITKKQNDIYSFGATLFFLSTAQDPTPISTSRPSDLIYDIDPALDDLVHDCTAGSVDLPEILTRCGSGTVNIR